MSNTPGVADHGTPPAPFIARARKFLVGAVGLAGTVASCEGIDHTAVGPWLPIVVAAATAFGVYQVPNAR